MNYSKIQELVSKKNMSIKDLSDKINFSRAGLYLALKEERLTVKTLEEIATALGVPVSTFFEEDNDKWPKSKLIDEVKKLDEEIDSIWIENDYLMDSVRSRRSLLRGIQNTLIECVEKLNETPENKIIAGKLEQSIQYIEDLEQFKKTNEEVELRRIERKKRRENKDS